MGACCLFIKPKSNSEVMLTVDFLLLVELGQGAADSPGYMHTFFAGVGLVWFEGFGGSGPEARSYVLCEKLSMGVNVKGRGRNGEGKEGKKVGTKIGLLPGCEPSFVKPWVQACDAGRMVDSCNLGDDRPMVSCCGSRAEVCQNCRVFDGSLPGVGDTYVVDPGAIFTEIGRSGCGMGLVGGW